VTARELAAGLQELDVVALTIEAEAGGEPLEGAVAVAGVLRNRAAWGRWGATLRAVCLAPAQFSCWAPVEGEANYARLAARLRVLRRGGPDADAVRRAFERSYWIAAAALWAPELEDVSGGADHYYAPAAMRPAGRVPAWARGHVPTAAIGGHRFYKLRKG
jgi:N-acetylmuramoyl-L-alanine amidase